jgi:hypothetical protein
MFLIFFTNLGTFFRDGRSEYYRSEILIKSEKVTTYEMTTKKTKVYTELNCRSAVHVII